MEPFKVVCINTAGKPNEIPQSVWNLLRKNDIYTVTRVTKLNIQGGQYGYQLAEIDLSPYEPYIYFAAYRFRKIEPIKNEEEEEMEELLEAA